MKRLLIFLGFVIVAFTSCDKDDDTAFDQSSDERLNEALTNYQNILVGAPNGWKAFIYPKGVEVAESELGGFSFYFKFSNTNRVQMLSDFDDVSSSVLKESSYRLKALQQPALIFDTYSYIHTIADPNPNVSFGWTGKGWVTDFEFAFTRATSDTVELVGRFNGVKVTMVRATKQEEDAFKAGRLKDILISSVTYAFSNPFLALPGANNTQAALSFDYNFLVARFLFLNAQNNVVIINAPFSHTLYGIHFKNPVTVNGITFQDMFWDDVNMLYYIMVGANRLNVVSSTTPILPLSRVIGVTFTAISVPTTPLQGQSTLFDTKYAATKTNLKTSGLNLDLSTIDFIFDGANKTMLVSVRLTRGATVFFANYSYSYTIDNAGIFKFTKVAQDGNGGAVENDMKPLLDHIQNERFKLDYIITSTAVLGQFISQDNSNFFFTGELE